MPKVTDNLRDARILADFSNLEPAQVDYFRHNYPDFAPQEWWDYEYKGETQWQQTQKLLRDSWKNQFRDGILNLMALLNSIIDPLRLADANRAGERAVRKLEAEWAGVPFKDNNETAPVSGTFDHIPIQRAIVYLFENSWQARFCVECNKRFVAAHPKNKFCSEKCSHNRRIKQEKKWWDEHGPAWRRSRFQRRRQKPTGRATRATKRRGIKD